MNDLVSEYQQYQDATAEGKKSLWRTIESIIPLFTFCRGRRGWRGWRRRACLDGDVGAKQWHSLFRYILFSNSLSSSLSFVHFVCMRVSFQSTSFIVRKIAFKSLKRLTPISLNEQTNKIKKGKKRMHESSFDRLVSLLSLESRAWGRSWENSVEWKMLRIFVLELLWLWLSVRFGCGEEGEWADSVQASQYSSESEYSVDRAMHWSKRSDARDELHRKTFDKCHYANQNRSRLEC